MREPGSHRSRAHRAAVRVRDVRSGSARRGDVQPLGLTQAARRLPASATLRMNELVAARLAAGQETIHLGFGEASFPLHPRLRAALAAGAASTAYPPVLGLPSLRAAIAGYLSRTRGLAVEREQVGVGPGSKPMIYACFQVLEGDILIPVPSWVSYTPQARMAGKRVIPVPAEPDDHLRLTVAALRGAAARARHDGADPRLLMLNSPSNPTGGMLVEEDVAAVAGWAREQGIAIISDEIYAELAHGWRPHVSPARFYPEGTIVTGSVSKAFSTGGWRLGYAAVPAGEAGRRALSAVRAVASEIWSAAAGPMQVAATAAYAGDADLERYVSRSARLHAYATARLHAALVEQGAICPRPAGGFYLYPDFEPWREPLARRGVSTGMDLARLLLEEWGVATLPAGEFGERPEVLRLRLATSRLFEPDGAASPEAREEWLWRLLERADELPNDAAASAEPTLELPALERVIRRLGEFVASLG
jgi:aspartate aminotransferase